MSLELSRAIASRLADHPEWIEMARANLDRWEQSNTHAPGLVRCYQEWRDLLGLPLETIRGLLVEESDNARRLRQSSPFAGSLAPREVWEIKERCRDETIRA
jgi:hypothetical protein